MWITFTIGPWSRHPRAMTPRGRPRTTLPQPFADEPFTRRQAVGANISDGRLSCRDLHRPFHGVRMPSSTPINVVTLAHAYTATMHPSHAFSHVTAAQLLGLPIPLYALESAELYVSAPRSLRRPRVRGVRGRDVADALWEKESLVLTMPDGEHLVEFPIVAPRLMWAQLAESLDERDLVAAGDALITRFHPGMGRWGRISDTSTLASIVAEFRGRRGAVRLTNAIGHIREGPLSRPETLLRLMAVEAGIPEPVLNVEVHDDEGQPISLSDLVWPHYRTVVEYEGDGHRSSRGKFRSDIDRFGRLADADWAPHRAHAGHVFGDPNELLARVARSLMANGWQPPRRGLRRVNPARH